MRRNKLISYLANRIAAISRPHPVRVAIDGPDAAGKTTLADELVVPLRNRGRKIIRASIDGFHRRAEFRHQRGDLSPEGYYRDSFDHNALITSLLSPLGPNGSLQYRRSIFDYRTNSEVESAIVVADRDAVLLFAGVFLFRPELIAYWDYGIFVEASFETILARAEQRDAGLFGGIPAVRHRYEKRYIPGQKLYYVDARPEEHANIVIDNNEPDNARVINDCPEASNRKKGRKEHETMPLQGIDG